MGTVYLDLETTGTEKDNAIVEIAATYYKDGKRLSAFDFKCNDSKAIVNLDALKVNKTKFSELDARQPELTGLKLLFDWLLSIQDSDLEMVGVNPQFDFNFLKNRAQHYGIIIGSVIPYRLRDLAQDVRLLAKLGLIVIKKSGKGNTLLDSAIALGVKVDETKLHSAVGDVELYAEVDKAIIERFKQAMCACSPQVKVENEQKN